jgi:signal transduction histidine kinase
MRIKSLAIRLFLASAGWGLVLLVVAGILLSGIYRASVERNFDERLHVYLKSLIASVEWSEQGEILRVGNVGEPRFETLFSGWYWQIRKAEAGAPASFTSPSLWIEQLALPSEAGIASDAQGISEADIRGPEQEPLRIIERRISFADSSTAYSFAVAGNRREVEQDVAAFRNSVIWALGLLGAAMAATALFQVRYGLRPLQTIRAQLSDIRAGTARHLTGVFPSEIDSLAHELNALIDANSAIVERARTHVGNLAHALKTPLSVITNEVGNARTPLARKVAEQTAIMRDQIARHLERARMAARSSLIGVTTDVRPVKLALARTMEKIHGRRAISVHVACPENAVFSGEKQDFEELAGNIIDNACKWAGSRVSAAVEISGREHKKLRLVVDDDGPGLTAAERSEVLRRGARIDESTPGSGLGLAIVAELVQLYSGRLSLSASPSGGLRVEVELPAASRLV